MAESKKNSSRKGKVEAFKEKAKERSKQQETPKTHLIPLTEWQTTDTLDLRGDLLEAQEQQMVLTYQALQEANAALNQAHVEFQKAAHVMQMVMQQNIRAGKIKVKYSWNNGEDATPEDVAQFEAQMKELQDLQKKQFEEKQQLENASKTGLVGPGGEPIGTTQNLDEQDSQDEDDKKWEGIADQSRAAAEETTED